MGYSIHQDMQEIYDNPDRWINHGRNILLSSCKHKDGAEYEGYCEKCDISEDSAIPIMNYLYPLELNSFDETKILKVVKETNCTVLENVDSGEWFLVLCGGGMDLSQDIAYSYILLETWMPDDLLMNVSKQPLLSLGRKQFKILGKQIRKQFKMRASNYKQSYKGWGESLKSLKDIKK
jgi:hypothetical protein